MMDVISILVALLAIDRGGNVGCFAVEVSLSCALPSSVLVIKFLPEYYRVEACCLPLSHDELRRRMLW